MWSLLTGRRNECSWLQDLLEDAVRTRPDAESVQKLTMVLAPRERIHFAACQSCRQVAEDLLAAREIFKGVTRDAEVARPWFAQRVMAAIAAREKELRLALSPWGAVPRLASRLTWVTAVVLLAGSAWLYERPVPTPSPQASSVAAQESIFEAPPQMSQDDVLVNLQETNP
jgi:hypothetical protein